MTEQHTLTKEIKPVVIPFRCVVCNGFGTVSNARRTCHACQGKGYVLLPAEPEREMIYDVPKP